MAFSSSCCRFVNGSSSLIASRISSYQMRSKHSVSGAQNVSSDRALRQFVSSKSKSAGRNSAGRITIFHRGGGAKRLQRIIDLKRNTSSVGVVERIEYDPNRTSRIAVVRWVEGAEVGHQRKVNTLEDFAPPHKIFDPNMTTIKGQFSFSSLPGMVEQRKAVCSAPMADQVVVGLPKGIIPGSNSPFTSKATGSKLTSTKDVFLSAFSSSKVKGDNAPLSFVSSLGLPRIAIAGAKPDFFVRRMKDDAKGNESSSLNEIRKWDKDGIVWAHKIKRKAAVSWQSLRRQEMLGLVGVAEHNKPKLKLKATDKMKRDENYMVDRAPVTYVIATHKMEAGKMVMNCDSSKRLNNELLHRY